MGEFHDIIWVVACLDVGDAIFPRRKGTSEDSDCVHLGVCQVAGVKVAGCHIGLELLTPIEVGTRYNAGIEEPAKPFALRKVAIPLPNLSSIVSMTQSDTWEGVFFDVPSASGFGTWLEVRAAGQVSVHKQVRCERYIQQCQCGAFHDHLRSVLSRTTGDYTRQSLLLLSARSGNPLVVHSGASKTNGNIQIEHQYIDVV